mmetsp:Transcript_38187/g.101431  ORF Transcript_38187/g.101431 Transcript_38187/m.101431 type:complete len:92 (+) Transcript_38187:137-412(+)
MISICCFHVDITLEIRILFCQMTILRRGLFLDSCCFSFSERTFCIVSGLISLCLFIVYTECSDVSASKKLNFKFLDPRLTDLMYCVTSSQN